MLNNSKLFVQYLDEYDQLNQIQYKHNLLLNIQTEYNNTWSDGSNLMTNSIDMTNLQTDDQLQYFDIMKEDVNLEKKEEVIIEKKYIEIIEKIERIEDLLLIIDKYEYNEHYEYNIDFHSIVKIKYELDELNNMVGMNRLKQNVLDQLLYFLQKLHLNKDGTSDYKHTVIYGPPGTGKTEIAKIIGRMYSKIGILSKNQFIKVTRQDLVAGYLGQTAIKTSKVIDEAVGGVLFIDEAYSLASEEKDDSFSKECLDTICEALSSHKNDFMVIIAGYEKELNNTFFRVNKGLESRFIWKLTMEPYSAIDLHKIFELIVKNSDWEFSDNETVRTKWFEQTYKSFTSFGRDMEQLFTYVKICHSRRIYGLNENVRKQINSEDMNNGYDIFIENRKEKETPIIYGLYV